MARPRGLSVRVRLALSYAGFALIAGGLLLAVVWVFLLRYVPDGPILASTGFVPNRSDLLRAFGPAAAGVLAALLVLGLVGGWLLAGRMLAPLDRITAATRAAAGGSLSHRIRLEGRSDEFRELADAFDSMLARVEAHVTEQQRFAANASHELRTPLAISQMLLDVARSDPDRDVDELLDRLGTVTGRAIDLTEALLLLSRADQRAFERERVDLSLAVEEAAETLAPLAARHGVDVVAVGDAAPAVGSRALLVQMAVNLVHNAIVHNLPEGGWVRVRSAVELGSAVLRVESSGARIAPEVVATLAERFQRGAQRARTGDHAGIGLGLAIVDSIVRAHDGALELVPRPTGGLRVDVRLPLAPREP